MSKFTLIVVALALAACQGSDKPRNPIGGPDGQPRSPDAFVKVYEDA